MEWFKKILNGELFLYVFKSNILIDLQIKNHQIFISYFDKTVFNTTLENIYA